MRYYVEIYMSTSGWLDRDTPIISGWADNEDFKNPKSISEAPQELKDHFGYDGDKVGYKFLKGKTLEEVMTKFNIVPTRFKPNVVLNGFVDI